LNTIRNIEGERAAIILISAFNNEFWVVRSKAHDALLEFGPIAIIHLLEGALSPSGSISYWSQKTIEDICSRFTSIDVLINNACTFQHSFKKTFDGFEYTFQICYLAHFILTDQLFPLIQKAENGRIINVSSMVHAHTLDLDFIKDAEKYDGYKAYEVSKLANVLFTYELAERIKNTNITVNCLHPGVISTKLLHNGWGIGGADVSVGADNLLFLAFSDKVKNVSGKYFANKKAVPSSPITYDKKIRTDFWKYTEKILNYKPQWM
jgi:NAD(P)-dependent dehydrogenase (short-subunit alcohol dehydrogenase family)